MTAKRYLRYLPAIGVAAVVTVAVGLVLLLVFLLGDQKPPSPVRIQQVSILPMTPPPPIEKPPEPEIKKESMDEVDAPKDSPDNAPAGDDLGVDADGNGADNFGLKAIKGGHGLLDGGPFGKYSANLRSDLHDWIARDKKLRRENYSVVLRIWIARTGRIDRAELASSTGNGDLDQRLRVMVASLVGQVREPPPQEMPQPVRLGVRSQM